MLQDRLYEIFRKVRFDIHKIVSPTFRNANSHINQIVLHEFNRRVFTGPFKGMKYISNSNSSGLAPKILGIYERELHPLVYKLTMDNYENIVNIGCAEGYYAVGFAYTSGHNKNTLIHAYDTDEKALENLRKLAAINNVSDRIIAKQCCDHRELCTFSSKRTLIICDIEGEERFLLDPNLAPPLSGYDILVEVHDGGDTSDVIKKILYQRFSATHQIQLIKFTGRNEKDWNLIRWNKDLKQRKRAVEEGRKYGLEWMWMKRIPPAKA